MQPTCRRRYVRRQQSKKRKTTESTLCPQRVLRARVARAARRWAGARREARGHGVARVGPLRGAPRGGRGSSRRRRRNGLTLRRARSPRAGARGHEPAARCRWHRRTCGPPKKEGMLSDVHVPCARMPRASAPTSHPSRQTHATRRTQPSGSSPPSSTLGSSTRWKKKRDAMGKRRRPGSSRDGRRRSSAVPSGVGSVTSSARAELALAKAMIMSTAARGGWVPLCCRVVAFVRGRPPLPPLAHGCAPAPAWRHDRRAHVDNV